MTKSYEVTVGFWHKHQWQEPGTVLKLTDAEAKYLAPPLGHNVVEKKPSAAPAAQS